LIILDDETSDTFLQDRHIEIDQQSHFETGQLQIGQDLSFVDRLQAISGFQFKKEEIFYQKVDAITTIQMDALVLDRNRLLPFISHSFQIQFVAETLFIGGFQKTWSKNFVGLYGCPNDLTCKIFVVHRSPFVTRYILNQGFLCPIGISRSDKERCSL
jgi:hypothetical protein